VTPLDLLDQYLAEIPTGVAVGATGTIYYFSDVENAIYKVVTRLRTSNQGGILGPPQCLPKNPHASQQLPTLISQPLVCREVLQ
jgi:hypothetical protein